MKRMKRYLMLVFWLTATVMATAQQTGQTDTLRAFIDNNPKAVDFKVIYEGTNLYLSADDDNLLINLSVAHPALQMRLLMQHTSLYIDPTGKKKKKFEVKLPAAIDVKEELEALAPDREQASADMRPDIMPLLKALSGQGAVFRADGRELKLDYQRFHMELDQEEALINIYVLVPKEVLMATKGLSDRWSVGIFSVNDFANMPPPDPEGGEGMAPPPMGDGDDDGDIQELMQKDIREWTRFSIDEVNNVNIE